jgi:hypothetical protein
MMDTGDNVPLRTQTMCIEQWTCWCALRVNATAYICFIGSLIARPASARGPNSPLGRPSGPEHGFPQTTP